MNRERPLVLVADDEPDILELVGYRLRKAGYDIVSAPDGRAALELAIESRPDLAVLDVMMPHLDGYEVTQRIRAEKALEKTPVILLTARVQEQDIQRGFAAGADDYLRKPFSPGELQSRVQAILGRR